MHGRVWKGWSGHPHPQKLKKYTDKKACEPSPAKKKNLSIKPPTGFLGSK